MINRRSSAYYTLPEELSSGKTKETKFTMSFNMVVPKDMEKKAQKFMEDLTDENAKAFKKFMKKQVEKRLEG